MKVTLVILEVATDKEDEKWWESLGTESPERWQEHLPEHVHVTFVGEKELKT